MGKTTSHNQMRKGFTIIEISLFVAISAALIVGLLIGVTSSIARQRYTDSVQDLTDWLKTQYLAVSNPTIPEWNGEDLMDYTTWGGTVLANDKVSNRRKCNFTGEFPNIDPTEPPTPMRRGQSNCQLYGMLIVFGESINGQVDSNLVTTYTVLGMDDRRQPKNELGVTLENMYGGFSMLTGDPLNDLMVSDIFIPALHLSDNYNLQYSAETQNVAGDPLQAAILIVRPPRSGAVRTMFMNESIAVTDLWNDLRNSGDDPAGVFFTEAMLTGGFQVNGDFNICVASDDVGAAGGRRRNIRIRAGSSNASSIDLVAAEEGICD